MFKAGVGLSEFNWQTTPQLLSPICDSVRGFTVAGPWL